MLWLCSRDTIDTTSNAPVAMAVQLGDNPTYGWPRGPDDDKRRTGVETQKEESITNEWVWTMYARVPMKPIVPTMCVYIS